MADHNDRSSEGASGGTPPDRPAPYRLEKPVEETVLLEREVVPHVARITLNRPEKHNALYAPEGFIELAKRLCEAAEDDNVKVIILRGNGPSFCSGEDLKRTPFEAFGGTPGARLPQSKRVVGIRKTTELFLAMTRCPKPIVIQAHGTIIGASFQMVLCADVCIAAESARFSRAEQRIGAGGHDPFTGLLTLLHLGPKRQRGWLLTGREVDARTAAAWGLITEVVPDEMLEMRVLEWAQAIAAHATDGLVIGKAFNALLLEGLGMTQGWMASALSHPLFTNLVWRDDEWNFLKVRNSKKRTGDAFKEREAKWRALGF